MRDPDRRQFRLALRQERLEPTVRLPAFGEFVAARREVGTGAAERRPGLGELVFQRRKIVDPLRKCRLRGLVAGALAGELLAGEGKIVPGLRQIRFEAFDPLAMIGKIALEPVGSGRPS